MNNGDLISRSKAKEAIIGWDTNATDEELEWAIDRVPAVDAEPVRHGRWIKKKNCLTRCSECGTVQPYDAIGDDVIYWPCDYCHHCGAKMDGDEHEISG